MTSWTANGPFQVKFLICITIKLKVDASKFRFNLVVSTRNCVAFTLNIIVIQLDKVNCEKGVNSARNSKE